MLLSINFKDGASAIITILLMLIIVVIGSFGFIVLISSMDEHTSVIRNDPTNYSGIDYNTAIYNNTNETLHGLASAIPNFIWIIFIFLAVVFLTLLAIGLKRR